MDGPNEDAGLFGLPRSVTDPTTAVSTFGYDPTRGLPMTATSPMNLALQQETGHANDPDVQASTATVLYNSEDMPAEIRDPLYNTATPTLHRVLIDYQADATTPANLVVKVTIPSAAPGPQPQRQITLDPAGRVVRVLDERNVESKIFYTSSGMVKQIIRASNKPDPRSTSFKYNDLMELEYFDPPQGMTGRVSFDYRRFDENLNVVTHMNPPVPVQEGQVTKIAYPDQTAEYFSYGEVSGELEWHRRQDGTMIRIPAYPEGRDAQHRVILVRFQPPNPSMDNPAFDITYEYDEFNRVRKSTTTADGSPKTSEYEFDVLDRLTKYVPAPYLGITRTQNFTYTRDLAKQRWVTQVSAPNIAPGASWIYEEDTKGRLFKVTGPFSGSMPTRFFYDREGNLELTEFPNGMKEHRQYQVDDLLGRISLYQPGDVLVDQFTYSYFDAGGFYWPGGHIQREEDRFGNIHWFGYNNHYELISEAHTNLGAGTVFYDPDPSGSGNRIARRHGADTDYYGYAPNNKLRWINRNVNAMPSSGQMEPYTLLEYDANGRMILRDRKLPGAATNRVLTFHWDSDDRLRKVTEGPFVRFQAKYDEDGLRRWKADDWGAGPVISEQTWG